MTWWAPSFDSRVLMGVENTPQRTWPISFLTVKILSSLTTIGAGFATIILCFGPIRKPARFYKIWILPYVCLALLLVVFNHAFSRPEPQSVLDDGSILTAPVLENLLTLFSYVGPGFFAASLGLVLLGIGVRRNSKSPNFLPVSFAGDIETGEPKQRRKELLRFVLLVYALTVVAPLPVALVLLIATEYGDFTPGDYFWYQRLMVTLQALPVALVGLWFLRREGNIRPLFRLGAPKFLLISVVVPLLAYAGPRVALYVAAEVRHYFNPVESPGPPSFLELFGLPPVWAVFYLLPALLEEVGWRGYLQQRVVSEFGLRRGLFLVRIAWAVWHLPGEIGYLRMDWAVAAFIGRFASVFGILIPLGWLFWRTGSIVPVTILHALSNSLGATENSESFASLGWWAWGRPIVLALCGFWLFKSWPSNPEVSEQPITDAKSELPAVANPD